MKKTDIDEYFAESSVTIESYEIKEIRFLYPFNIRWSCIKCGDCCKDTSDRERRILLLPRDIRRIKEVIKENFSKKFSGGEPFIAEMEKIDGQCKFYEGKKCSIYPERALLCRMYPFWVKRDPDFFIIYADKKCPGIGRGKILDERFFKKLLKMAFFEREDIEKIMPR